MAVAASMAVAAADDASLAVAAAEAEKRQDMIYTLEKDWNVNRPGAVYIFVGDDGATFRCPCGKRQVLIKQPPHHVSFDKEGVITIDGSMGYHKTMERPENWCHFSIENGLAEMHEDALCPGASL